MLTFAKIGLVGFVLLSSKMAIAVTCSAGTFFDGKTCLQCPDNKQFTNIKEGAKSVEDCKGAEDYRCGKDFKNALEQELKCNAEDSSANCCTEWGWCDAGKENCEDYKKDQPPKNQNKNDDDDDTVDEAKKEKKDKDDDKTNAPSTTSDCHNEICIDFVSGQQYHHVFHILRDVYKYNTLFVKDKEEKNGRHLYKGIDWSDKKKKPKYAMWWKEGFWMIGQYKNSNTLIAFASAPSDRKCPEEINYDWSYYYSYENSWKNAGQGMSVYNECKNSYY